MINISISPDGEIIISQETPGERIYMGEYYARMDREGQSVSQETINDDERAAMFKQGWESAIRESQLYYVNGRIEESWNEMGVKDGSQDPHHNEPEGTGEETLSQPLIRPAADSGEPEKEAEADPLESRISRGTWTISDEELQAIKDAEFERGMAYVSPTVPPRYTAEQIAELRAEGYGQGIADSGAGQPERREVLFSSLRAVADKIAGEARDGQKHSSVDDLLVRVAESLGFEVTR